MTPQPQQEWTEVPALQRMRDELEAVAARDAREPMRRRRPRRQLGLALAGLLAALVVGVVLVAGPGEDEAVAGLREAPQALLEAGRYAYATTLEQTIEGRREPRATQTGVVDLKAGAFRFERASRRGTDQVLVAGDAQYARSVTPDDPDAGWARSPLPGGAGSLSGSAVPLSLAAVRALRDAGREEVVGTDERVDGIATTHYRLPMDAAAYAGLRGQAAADLRDVDGTLDVWLDGDDLPRRLRAAFASADGETRFTVDTRYAEFGRTEPVRAPATSRPANAAPLGADPVVASLRVAFGAPR